MKNYRIGVMVSAGSQMWRLLWTASFCVALALGCQDAGSLNVGSTEESGTVAQGDPVVTPDSTAGSGAGATSLRAPELEDLGDVGLVPLLFPSFVAGGMDADCDFSDPFGSCH